MQDRPTHSITDDTDRVTRGKTGEAARETRGEVYEPREERVRLARRNWVGQPIFRDRDDKQGKKAEDGRRKTEDGCLDGTHDPQRSRRRLPSRTPR